MGGLRARAGARRARRTQRCPCDRRRLRRAARRGHRRGHRRARRTPRWVPEKTARDCWTRSPPSPSIARAMRACASRRSPRYPSCPNIWSGRSATRRRRSKAPARRSTIRSRCGSGSRPTARARRSPRCTRSSKTANVSTPSPRRACGRSGCRRAAGPIRRCQASEPRGALRPPRDVRCRDGALPQSFLSSAATIGDASCLEPLARAWTAAGKDLTGTRAQRPPRQSCGARSSPDGAPQSRSCARTSPDSW